jgi:L-aspartate oxidase
MVFGKRVVEHTLGIGGDDSQEEIKGSSKQEMVATLPDRALTCASIPRLTLENLQSLMWEKVGLVRNGIQLLGAVHILSIWNRTAPQNNERGSQELSNLVLVGLIMAEAALMREESRGAHYRTDYPDTSPDWEKHIVFWKGA